MYTSLCLVLLLLCVSMSGCTQATATYQRAIYGYEFEPGTPCKKGEQWVNLTCQPRKGGPS